MYELQLIPVANSWNPFAVRLHGNFPLAAKEDAAASPNDLVILKAASISIAPISHSVYREQTEGSLED